MSVIANVEGSLATYYNYVQKGMQLTSKMFDFEVGWSLPALDDTLRNFFLPTGMSAYSLDDYFGRPFKLLDLTENKTTRTTKTFGSALIVARAVEHTRVTGEPIVLVTPSAANKAVALRDAVLRAYNVGLADPSLLRVVTIVPESSLPKLWASGLDGDSELSLANPMAIYRGYDREAVKKIATAAVKGLQQTEGRARRFKIWYTLNPSNYMVADLVRAIFEMAHIPPQRERWHAHAVSSAYGFLGHDLGRRLLADDRTTNTDHHYLLVQHLDTPDLVEAITGLNISSLAQESYESNGKGLLQRRDRSDVRLPRTCIALDDQVERTFYTRNPPTIPAVKALIDRAKGDGVVVSLSECLARYPQVVDMLNRGGYRRLPHDPRKLREWALVMAVVGAMTAVEENIIPQDAEVMLHASGAYGEDDFDQIDLSSLRPIANADEMLSLLDEVTS